VDILDDMGVSKLSANVFKGELKVKRISCGAFMQSNLICLQH